MIPEGLVSLSDFPSLLKILDELESRSEEIEDAANKSGAAGVRSISEIAVREMAANLDKDMVRLLHSLLAGVTNRC
ncbi:hypothetical protein SAMN05444581_12710 [Methylocapsa palsarum]|uniref:Uncharacterized protein n=2 Tax=Methylocapsa palsarum TaxID=1612308 RepID=A0A1I4CR98_9HYPH|nr:hypothetical protein SAMN05444581_12710 [Methylocapsa palsarum]